MSKMSQAVQRKSLQAAPAVGMALPAESVPETNRVLKLIFDLLRRAHGVDFGRYKRSTIHRRIAHRMHLRHIEALPDYLDLLRANKEEVEVLYQDLLITVTAFFRDPDVFEFLKSHIIPTILNSLPADMTARVWVPGCASGEEAYSIAMCFVEAAPDRVAPPGGDPCYRY